MIKIFIYLGFGFEFQICHVSQRSESKIAMVKIGIKPNRNKAAEDEINGLHNYSVEKVSNSGEIQMQIKSS